MKFPAYGLFATINRISLSLFVFVVDQQSTMSFFASQVDSLSSMAPRDIPLKSESRLHPPETDGIQGNLINHEPKEEA